MRIIRGLSVLFVAATLASGLAVISSLADGSIIAMTEERDVLSSSTFDILPEAFGDDSNSDSGSDSASGSNSDSSSDSASDSDGPTEPVCELGPTVEFCP